MIEYVEIRSKTTREVIGLIDGAKSVIWHTTYYGVGDFEIYANLSEKHVNLLTEGNYVTRPGEIEIGIIEKIQTESTTEGGDMIVASGRFAKSILDRRHIYKISGKQNTPTILSGNVETAVRTLVYNNIINCSFDAYRNISYLELGEVAGITKTIVDKSGNATQKQVSFDNLYDYTEEILKEYALGALICIDDETYKLKYKLYEGADRSVDNTAGNEPIIFSREYDNLSDSNYSYDSTPKKNSALIGGAGEGLDRFYSVVGTKSGLDRREMWVNASSLNKKYKDQSDEEQEYTDAEYKAMLDALAAQNIAAATELQEYSATINVNGGKWRLNEDYFIGDIVTFQDNNLGKYANVRIVELTEVQDENGYSIDPVFEFELTEGVSGVQVLTTENHITLTTQRKAPLLTEASAEPEETAAESGVKISELEEAQSLNGLCCFPVVNNGETKKVTFGTILNLIYPVGALYMSVNNVNPGTLFGGTWEQIKDRFLLSAGDTYAAGSTGGEAEHTLTVDEMPSHSHGVKWSWATGGAGYIPLGRSGDIAGATNSEGGNQAHNNMPPYLTVYVWKRTA